MDRAINKETNEIVTAFEIGENASYQDKKDIWFAPKDSITNWDELKEENIVEVPIHFVSEKRFKNWRGTDIFCSPHFSLFPNSKAKTVQESKEHKMLKDFVYNYIKKENITLIISKLKRKNEQLKEIKIKDLSSIIDWNSYNIEITNRGYKTLRADVLLPFKIKHEFLGYGIDFEIQLQKQTEKITFDRSIKWALQGFSVVWLFQDDFYFNKDKTQIELKNKEVKVFSYSQELYFSGKEFIKNLKRTVIEQSRLLDNKIEEIKNKTKKEIKDIDAKAQQLNLLYEELKEKINGFFGYKIKELGKTFNEEVAKRVEENFFETNKEDIKEIIHESLIEYLKDVKLEEVITNFADTIDYDSIMSDARRRVFFEVDKKLEGFTIWKEVLNNPPECPYCENTLLKLIQTKKGSWCYVCESCKKFQSLPQDIANKLRCEDDFV